MKTKSQIAVFENYKKVLTKDTQVKLLDRLDFYCAWTEKKKLSAEEAVIAYENIDAIKAELMKRRRGLEGK